MQQIKIPEQVSYDSFNEFVQEIQRAFLVTDVDIRNWFSRISPFFILDRRKFLTVFEKAKELLKEMTVFLTKEYVKTKTLEETFQLTDRLKTLENQLSNLNSERAKADGDKALVSNEIAETRQKMEELETKGAVSQLHQAFMEIDALSMEAKRSLQHLQKPFVKLQALSLHGGGSGLTQDELNKVDEYLQNPFEALATEDNSYPLLRQILQKTARLLADGKLKLKPDKMRKAEQAIENIMNKNALASLQQKCIDAVRRKTQLSTSQEVRETKGDLLRLQEALDKLERRKSSIESEESAIKQTYDETLGKIQNHKSQIEKNILGFLDMKVHIG
jgi:chromosome segregation ATPase